MAKGQRPPAAGKGRPKGAVNKTTKAAKEAIAEVFEGMGGAPALLEWAKKNQERFYTIIWPKIIPLQVGGDPNNPIVHEIRRTIVHSQHPDG